MIVSTYLVWLQCTGNIFVMIIFKKNHKKHRNK